MQGVWLLCALAFWVRCGIHVLGLSQTSPTVWGFGLIHCLCNSLTVYVALQHKWWPSQGAGLSAVAICVVLCVGMRMQAGFAEYFLQRIVIQATMWCGQV